MSPNIACIRLWPCPECVYLVFAVIGQHHAVERPQKLGTVWTIVRGLEFCRLSFVNELSSRLGDKLGGFVGFSSLTVQGFPVS